MTVLPAPGRDQSGTIFDCSKASLQSSCMGITVWKDIPRSMFVLLLEQKTPASAPVLESSIEDIYKNSYIAIVIAIKVQGFDYAASLDSFVAKNIDGCTMTNMEALDMPAAAGVDSTVIIVGDYSNGNDAVMVRNGLTLDKLPGQPVMLVQKTVSEYLLERAM